MAVSKYHGAQGFSPWVTWTSGAYRQFMDAGGTLQPGWNLAYNGTGQPEPLVPARPAAAAPIVIKLEVKTGPGASALDRAIVDIIKDHARIDGGGDVQVAFGSS